MRPINKKAQAVMGRLTDGITEENSHTRIDNNKPDSGIMAVVVEWVGDCKLGDVFSIAHYFEQNGDLMVDPEMTFLKAEDGRYYPMSYKLGSLGVYREGMICADGEPRYINESEQRDEAILVNVAGSLPIRVGKQFGSYRKLGKMHQNVLVFYKGDPKQIKLDYGEIVVEMIEDEQQS